MSKQAMQVRHVQPLVLEHSENRGYHPALSLCVVGPGPGGIVFITAYRDLAEHVQQSAQNDAHGRLLAYLAAERRLETGE